MIVTIDDIESPQVVVGQQQRPFIEYKLPVGHVYVCPDDVVSQPMTFKLCQSGPVFLVPVIAVRTLGDTASQLFAAGAQFSMFLLADYLKQFHVLPLEMRIGVGTRCDMLVDDKNNNMKSYRAFMTCIMVLKNGSSPTR